MPIQDPAERIRNFDEVTFGYSEEDAPHHIGPVDIYLSEFRPMKHTLSGRDEKMMMKLIVDAQTRIVVAGRDPHPSYAWHWGASPPMAVSGPVGTPRAKLCSHTLPSRRISSSSREATGAPSASYQTGMRWPHQSWREMHHGSMFSIQLK